METRFVETTTKISMDAEIDQAFRRIASNRLMNAIEDNHSCRSIDIFLVSEWELDEDHKLEWDRQHSEGESPISEGMDLLGVYIHHDPKSHRPIIKMSPERIMKVCVAQHETSLKVAYPAVFCAVAIHELAHFLMADGYHDNDCRAPWNSVAERPGKDQTAGDVETSLWTAHCHRWSRKLRPGVDGWRHVIEESLANAFVIKQNFGCEEMKLIRSFISKQPPAYSAAERWKLDHEPLNLTARSWRWFKTTLDLWDDIYLDKAGTTPLQALAERLLNEPILEAVDFITEFQEYLASRLAKSKSFSSSKGAFGLHWTLDHDQGIAAVAIKFLEIAKRVDGHIIVDKENRINIIGTCTIDSRDLAKSSVRFGMVTGGIWLEWHPDVPLLRLFEYMSKVFLIGAPKEIQSIFYKYLGNESLNYRARILACQKELLGANFNGNASW